MDSSIASAINKIINREQENENKLIEKRTLESSLATTNRLIHDVTSRTAKLQEECAEAIARTDALEIEVTIASARRRALQDQLLASTEELQLLKVQAEEGISKVWNSRNTLCAEVQNVGDQCDVWALLTRPKRIEVPLPLKKQTADDSKAICEEDDKLKKVIKRRQSLLEERERLVKEPDCGEEFVRIMNAIRYSEEMSANMKAKFNFVP